jgi:hypothetical protein
LERVFVVELKGFLVVGKVNLMEILVCFDASLSLTQQLKHFKPSQALFHIPSRPVPFLEISR